jgi:hypothetical protein
VAVIGQRDTDVVEQIQLLAEEIVVLRAIGDDDRRRVSADRVVALKVGTSRHLRALLPAIPAGPVDVRRQLAVGAVAAAAPTRSGVDARPVAR